MRLEDLIANASVRGILPDNLVTEDREGKEPWKWAAENADIEDI